MPAGGSAADLVRQISAESANSVRVTKAGGIKALRVGLEALPDGEFLPCMNALLAIKTGPPTRTWSAPETRSPPD
ncbi:MAG: hypothetical protein ACYC0T_12755 [Ramlibacter sp.]